jgi:hypothetical protein
MSYAYRSAYEHIVGMRLAETRLASEALEPMQPQFRAIRSARIARALAGGVGIVGVLCMIAFAAFDDGEGVTYALLGSVAASLATYALVRAGLEIANTVRSKARLALLTPSPRLTGQLDADIAAIDASHPLVEVARRLASVELWSTALPLAAISLLAPLTLHFGFASMTSSITDFGKWIRISLVIVGHAHLALLALSILFARRMAKSDFQALAAMSIHREWAKVWGLTIAVSAVPGALLLGVPPVLTALTGIAFIPLMFVLMHRRIMKERATLALAEEVSLRAATDSRPAVSALDQLAVRADGEVVYRADTFEQLESVRTARG